MGTKSRSAFRCFLCKSFVLFLRTADARAQALEQKLQTLRWLNWRIVQNSFTVDKNSYQSICGTRCVLNGIFVFSLLAHLQSQRGCAVLTRFILCSSHFMHQAMLITIKHVLVCILNCPLALPGAAAEWSANECHTLKTCWCIKLF